MHTRAFDAISGYCDAHIPFVSRRFSVCVDCFCRELIWVTQTWHFDVLPPFLQCYGVQILHQNGFRVQASFQIKKDYILVFHFDSPELSLLTSSLVHEKEEVIVYGLSMWALINKLRVIGKQIRRRLVRKGFISLPKCQSKPFFIGSQTMPSVNMCSTFLLKK